MTPATADTLKNGQKSPFILLILVKEASRKSMPWSRIKKGPNIRNAWAA
ncbi:conserved hypothetical protein [delta proteobacterium NaphS2]|nr:conserved hypothetical protein [delta proteobacterium NaphS2]